MHLFIGTMDGHIVETSPHALREGRVLRRLFLTSAPVELSVLRGGEALLGTGDVPLVVIRCPDRLQVTGLTLPSVSACVALSDDVVVFAHPHGPPTLTVGAVGEVQKMNRTFLPLFGTVTHLTDTPAWGGVVVAVRRPASDGIVFVAYQHIQSPWRADGAAVAATDKEETATATATTTTATEEERRRSAVHHGAPHEIRLLDNERCVFIEFVGVGAPDGTGDPHIGRDAGAVVLVGSSFVFPDEPLARSSRLTWYTLRHTGEERANAPPLRSAAPTTNMPWALSPRHHTNSTRSSTTNQTSQTNQAATSSNSHGSNNHPMNAHASRDRTHSIGCHDSSSHPHPAKTTLRIGGGGSGHPASHPPRVHRRGAGVLTEVSGQDIAGALQCCARVPHDRGRIALGISGCVVLYRWSATDAGFVAEERCRIGLGIVKLLPVVTPRCVSPTVSRLIALDARHSAFFLCVDRVQDRITVQGRESQLRGVMDGCTLNAQTLMMCDDQMNVYCMHNEARVPPQVGDNPTARHAPGPLALPTTRQYRHHGGAAGEDRRTPPAHRAATTTMTMATATATTTPTTYRLAVRAQMHWGDLITCMQPGSFALVTDPATTPEEGDVVVGRAEEEEEEEEGGGGGTHAVTRAGGAHASDCRPAWMQPPWHSPTTADDDDDDDPCGTTHRFDGVSAGRGGRAQVVFGTAHGGFGTLTSVTPLAFVVMQSVARAVGEAMGGVWGRAAATAAEGSEPPSGTVPVIPTTTAACASSPHGGFDAESFHAVLRVGESRGYNRLLGRDAARARRTTRQGTEYGTSGNEDDGDARHVSHAQRRRGVCDGRALEAFVSLRRGARPHVCLLASVMAANTLAAALPEWGRFQAGAWVPECDGGAMQSLTQLQNVVEWVNERLTQEQLPTLPFRAESVEALVIAFQRVY